MYRLRWLAKEAVGFTGLGLVCFGLYRLYGLPWAAIVLGAALVLLDIAQERRG